MVHRCGGFDGAWRLHSLGCYGGRWVCVGVLGGDGDTLVDGGGVNILGEDGVMLVDGGDVWLGCRG